MKLRNRVPEIVVLDPEKKKKRQIIENQLFIFQIISYSKKCRVGHDAVSKATSKAKIQSSSQNLEECTASLRPGRLWRGW